MDKLDSSLDDLIAKDNPRSFGRGKAQPVSVFDRLGVSRGSKPSGLAKRGGRGGRGSGGSLRQTPTASRGSGRGASVPSKAGTDSRPAGRGNGQGGSQANSKMIASMRRNRSTSTEGGDTVVQLFDTEVVRISGKNIVLNSGGFMTQTTMLCMNEAIGEYGFTVKAAGDNWIVSDGKSKWLRFYDNIVIEGGAELSAAGAKAAPKAGGAWGAPRNFKRANSRYTPY